MHGWTNPGDPGAAAEQAHRDATLSHTANGVHAAMFAAAVVAAAAPDDAPDVHACLRAGLAVVPPGSRLAGAVRHAVRLAGAHDDFDTVVDRLHAVHSPAHHWVHAVPNTALIAAALTHADGDFTGSVSRAVSGGWDTDSNGATVGGVAGLLAGSPAALPAHWTAPLKNRLATSVGDFDGTGFDTLAHLTHRETTRPCPSPPPPPPSPLPDRPARPRPRHALRGTARRHHARRLRRRGDQGRAPHPARPLPGTRSLEGRGGPVVEAAGRNKHTITLDLSKPAGRTTLLRLAATADVVVENFRPGTLEKWDLGWDELSAVNPRLVLTRVTGFGQFGPYARRPGFGTLAEAMSGFAAMTGEPDAPPTLPPFGLADSIAALATAYAVMTALAARERTGEGQVVDMAIIEPILTVLGPQPLWYDQLGHVQPRTGNRSQNNAPRNTYRTADGTWVAVSTSAQSVAERVMRLVGRPELIDEPWFATGADRARHADVLDAAVGDWIARHGRADVLAAFEKAEAAVAPVQDVRDVMSDPQYQALDTVTTVDDPELGPLRMQNVLFRLSATPGAIRWAGRPHGADTEEVLTGLGLTPADVKELREEGVV